MYNSKVIYWILAIFVLILIGSASYLYFKTLPETIASEGKWKITSEIRNTKVILASTDELNSFITKYAKFEQSNPISIFAPDYSVQNKIVKKLTINLTDVMQGKGQVYDLEGKNVVLYDRSSAMKIGGNYEIKIYLSPDLLSGTDQSNRFLTIGILEAIYRSINPISSKNPKENSINDLRSNYKTYIDNDHNPIFIVSNEK